MTYKDQEVFMHATKKYTIKNKESWCAIRKSVKSIFFIFFITIIIHISIELHTSKLVNINFAT